MTRAALAGALLALAAPAGLYLVAVATHPVDLMLTGFDLRVYRGAGLQVWHGTAAAGWAALPQASAQWWLGPDFLAASRTGFIGFQANQSLCGLITRMAGSGPVATGAWLGLAVPTAVAGLLAAARLHMAGRPVHGTAVLCAHRPAGLPRSAGITTGSGSPRCWPRWPTARCAPAARPGGPGGWLVAACCWLSGPGRACGTAAPRWFRGA